MDPLFIIVPILLAIPALYLLFRRPIKRQGGDLRPDAAERPELTGEEQWQSRHNPPDR